MAIYILCLQRDVHILEEYLYRNSDYNAEVI